MPHPNDRLLQLLIDAILDRKYEVVMPILTTGFYNSEKVIEPGLHMSCHTHPNDRLLQQLVRHSCRTLNSCHTHPNDRLLQLRNLRGVFSSYEVVIPILTTGFYNIQWVISNINRKVVIPILTTGFYNSSIPLEVIYLKVVIPILTTGFYNLSLE